MRATGPSDDEHQGGDCEVRKAKPARHNHIFFGQNCPLSRAFSDAVENIATLRRNVLAISLVVIVSFIVVRITLYSILRS